MIVRQRIAQRSREPEHCRRGDPVHGSPSERHRPTNPLTTRARRMPSSSPLSTVPTTCPRRSGGASFAANGRIRCATIPASPVANPAALTSARFGATAIIATVSAGDHRHHDDQPPSREHVAQRHECEHAERRARLRPHGQIADGAVRHAKRPADFRQQRLAVVNVGYADGAGRRHHSHSAPVDPHLFKIADRPTGCDSRGFCSLTPQPYYSVLTCFVNCWFSLHSNSMRSWSTIRR